MKNFDKIALRIFFYELPVLLVFFILCQWLSLETVAKTSMLAQVVYNFCGLVVFGSWAFLVIYFSCKILLKKSFRQVLLSKITFMRERDEREVFLTGQAAKNTMLTTLAILIFLFCLSSFNFSYIHVPQELAINGKTSEFSWGIGFNSTNDSRGQAVEKISTTNADLQYSYQGIPISTQMVLLGLIGWQIVSYNFYKNHHE